MGDRRGAGGVEMVVKVVTGATSEGKAFQAMWNLSYALICSDGCSFKIDGPTDRPRNRPAEGACHRVTGELRRHQEARSRRCKLRRLERWRVGKVSG